MTLRICNCVNYFLVGLRISLISDLKITAKYFTVSASGCMLYRTPHPPTKTAKAQNNNI